MSDENDLAPMIDHTDTILSVIEPSDSYEKVKAHLGIYDDFEAELEMRKDIYSSAIMSMVQNVTAVEKERQSPLGSNSFVTRTEFETLLPIREAANQAGSFTDNHAAEKYEIKNLNHEVM